MWRRKARRSEEMLKLLLDEHVSPAVGEGLRIRRKGLVVRWMLEWEKGRFLGVEDSVWLAAAQVQGLTLLTYDRRTIPPILKAWAEEGRAHGGVIFVDEKTIFRADVGGLIRAVLSLWDADGCMDWTNRVRYLRR